MSGTATKTKIILISATKGSFNELVHMTGGSLPSIINTWSRQNSYKLKSLNINDETDRVKATFSVEDKTAAGVVQTKRFNIEFKEVTNLTGA